MKALVFHDVGDIRLDDVEDPKIQEQTDAIIRLTSSAICRTDLHVIRGTLAGMRPGAILGHEGVGVVEEVGRNVRNLNVGDRVVIPSTIGCGYCMFCRRGFYAQCDNANPNGPQAATAFTADRSPRYRSTGCRPSTPGYSACQRHGCQAARAGTDEQAIMISDIFPTAYCGAESPKSKTGTFGGLRLRTSRSIRHSIYGLSPDEYEVFGEERGYIPMTD